MAHARTLLLLLIMTRFIGLSNAYGEILQPSVVNNMKLELYPPPDNEVTVLATATTEKQLTDAIMGQPWADITFLVLKRDEENWFEVSGAAGAGFSARYMEEGEEFVASRAPKSLDEMKILMKSYLLGDGNWKSAMAWE